MARNGIKDGLGSVRGLANTSGALTQDYAYEPYGPPDGVTPADFGFTGEQTDSNGQIYLRARYYDPATGVFTALDSCEGTTQRPMSMNGYSWVEGNPINTIDPSGKISIPDIISEITCSSTITNSNPCENPWDSPLLTAWCVNQGSIFEPDTPDRPSTCSPIFIERTGTGGFSVQGDCYEGLSRNNQQYCELTSCLFGCVYCPEESWKEYEEKLSRLEAGERLRENISNVFSPCEFGEAEFAALVAAAFGVLPGVSLAAALGSCAVAATAVVNLAVDSYQRHGIGYRDQAIDDAYYVTRSVGIGCAEAAAVAAGQEITGPWFDIAGAVNTVFNACTGL